VRPRARRAGVRSHGACLIAGLLLASIGPAQLQFADVRKAHLPDVNTNGFPGQAFAVGDVDGDGDQDLVAGPAVGLPVPTRLYLNDGTGIFADATEGRMPFDTVASRAVALGDADGDGDLDMVLARNGQDRLYLNDGAGRFGDATPGHMPVNGGTSTCLALCDVDGDGDRDIVFGGTFGQSDRLCLNDGNGVFTEAPGLPFNNDGTAAVVSGDVDGDGDQDLLLLVQRRPPGTVRLYLNDGKGTFTDVSSARLPVEQYIINTLAPADVDGDGDLDIVLASVTQKLLYLNDGTGQFTDATATHLPPPGPGGSDSVAAGDVDGDGDPDIAWGTRSGLLLYLNDGKGTFTDATGARLPADGGAAGIPTREVVLADADADGDPDMVLNVLDVGRLRAVLYLNDGAGAFTDATASSVPPVVSTTNDLATEDLDGDGDPDIVLGNTGQDRLYLNDGAGTFTDATEGRMPVDDGVTISLAVGDVDGDGDQDLVLARTGLTNQRQNRLYLNDGAGTFTDATVTNLPVDDDITTAIGLGDVDGDGDLDVVIGNGNGQDRLYLNDGAGRFTDATSGRMPPDSAYTLDLALADVDGDGDLDIVLARTGQLAQRQNRLYLNDGAGRFTDATAARMPVDGEITLSVVLGDVDGDGDPDIVLGNTGQDRLYLNDGGGTFTDATAARMPADSEQTGGLALGDVDGDGSTDIVLASRGLRQNRLYLNDGAGTFADVTADRMPADQDDTTSVALRDVDGDGDRDIVFGNKGNIAPSRVHRNLRRQLSTPYLARLDRAFRLDVYARHGPYRWSDVAFPFVSDTTARIPLPPAGTVGLDPSRLIPFPPFVIPQATGVGSTTFAVPAMPALVGVPIHAQAVLVQLPADVWFTNVTTDVIVDL